LLDRETTEIEAVRAWSPRVTSRLEALIRSGEARTFYRVNPLAFARDRGIARR
jgi:hypothetical protein